MLENFESASSHANIFEFIFAHADAALSMLVALSGAFVALASLFLVLKTRRAKRKMLVNALYHHVNTAISDLDACGGQENAEFWKAHFQNITSDPAYVPFFVLSRANDLTYDQIIETLDVLKSFVRRISEKEEEQIMRYFHLDKEAHALAESFSAAKFLSTERKSAMLNSLIKTCEKTLRAAKEVDRILAKRLKRRARTTDGRNGDATGNAAARLSN